MLRLTCLRFTKGRIQAWAPNKHFGFIGVTDEKPHPKAVNVDGDSWRLLVHRDSILKNPTGRTPRSIRRGVEVEFDVELKDERPVAVRVAAPGGEPLTPRCEVRDTAVNVDLMNRTMLPGGAVGKGASGGYTLHDRHVRSIIQFVARINVDLQRTAAMQRSTLQMLVALLHSKKVGELEVGEEYAALKKIMWADRLAARQARKAANAAKAGVTGHIDDDDVDGDEDVSDDIMKLLHGDGGTTKQSPSSAFHSADELVDMADEEVPVKKAKKKKVVGKGGAKKKGAKSKGDDDDDDLFL